MPTKLTNALKWIVSILHKHNIPFQISGGFAAHIYSAKRPVNDIDIDIPETDLDLLIEDIKPYITFGPDQYKDEKWDLKLITLEYNNQEIDIGGAFDTKIFDEQNQVWTHCPANLQTAEIHHIAGMDIPVVAPQDLIEYKKLLNGDHQKTDIAAVEAYIASKQRLEKI